MAFPSFSRVLKIIAVTLVSVMVLNVVSRLILQQRVSAAMAQAEQADAHLLESPGGQESEQFLTG